MITTNLLELKKTTTPAEFSQKIRRMGEYFWWEPGQFYVITSYELAKSILMSEDYSCDRSSFFISRMPEMNLSLLDDFFKVVSKMMVMSDGEAHQNRRRICYHGFTAYCIQQLKPVIDKTIEQCLKKVNKHSTYDFVTELAQILPSTTLAELFHIPHHERDAFYHWSNNMTQFFGGASAYQNRDGIKVNDSAQKLYHYFANLIEKRRKNPDQDFLGTLLTHQSHFDLTDDEIISQAIMMLVAGQVTTTDQLCNNLFTMLSLPGLWQEIRENIEHLDEYIEECNRLDPAVTFLFRIAKNDTCIGQEKISKGAVIFMANHAINRDPHYFLTPDRININDHKNQPFSYGYGGHFCLGAKLGRIMMHSVFHALLTRFPHLKMDAYHKASRKHHSLAFSGFECLFLSGFN